MRVAILGSDSFSGNALASYLAKNGYDTRTFGRNWDILEPKALAAEIKHDNPDVIVNFIAKGQVDPSWDNPKAWFDVNVGAPCEVVNHLINFPLKAWIQISTPEVCGSGVCHETFDYNPSTPYAASKAAMEMALRAYGEAFGFPYIITRSENVYGHQQKNRLIPNALAARHKKAVLPLTSPEVLRSFIHIDDVCAALDRIIQCGGVGEIYNIGLGLTLPLSEVVEICGAKWRKVPGRRVEDQCYYLNSDKIRQLGWTPQYTLQEGIEKTWAEKLTSYSSRQFSGKSAIAPKYIDKWQGNLTSSSSTGIDFTDTEATATTGVGNQSRAG